VDPVLNHKHVSIRRSHVDPAGLDFLIMHGVLGRQWSCPIQDAGQCADAVGREVMDYEEGSGQVSGEARGEPSHGLDTAGGKSHYDYIMTRHAGAFRNEY
jgi:hypothetical protein